jgi:hypothetical protein
MDEVYVQVPSMVEETSNLPMQKKLSKVKEVVQHLQAQNAELQEKMKSTSHWRAGELQ